MHHNESLYVYVCVCVCLRLRSSCDNVPSAAFLLAPFDSLAHVRLRRTGEREGERLLGERVRMRERETERERGLVYMIEIDICNIHR